MAIHLSTKRAKEPKTNIIDQKKESKNFVLFSRAHLPKFVPIYRLNLFDNLDDEIMAVSETGGKGSAKTRLLIFYAIAIMEEFPKSTPYLLRAFKNDANTAFWHEFQKARNEIEARGFKIAKYEDGRSEIYRMVNKIKTQNQRAYLGSFEDYNSIAGQGAYDGGFIPYVGSDEIVNREKNSKENTDANVWFFTNLQLIQDTLSRSIRAYRSLHKDEKLDLPRFLMHMTSNAWSPHHPNLKALELFIPSDKFIEWVLIDPLNNVIKVFDYIPSHYIDPVIPVGMRFARSTKFANPQINIIERECHRHGITTAAEFKEKKHLFDFESKTENYFSIDWRPKTLYDFDVTPDVILDHFRENYGRTILSQLQDHYKNQRHAELSRILGVLDKPNISDGEAFRHWKIKWTDTDLLTEIDEIKRVTYSWDIDNNRKHVLTVELQVLKFSHLVKEEDGEVTEIYKTNTIVRPQRFFKVPNDPKTAQALDWNNNQMCNIVREEIDKLTAMYGKKLNTADHRVVIDDNTSLIWPRHQEIFRKWKLPFHIGFSKAIKTDGDSYRWGIASRTSSQNQQLDAGFTIVDSRNIQYREDLKQAIVREGHEKRDESGSYSKFYDTINSREYGNFYHRYILSNVDWIAGDPDDYMVKEKEDGKANS